MASLAAGLDAHQSGWPVGITDVNDGRLLLGDGRAYSPD